MVNYCSGCLMLWGLFFPYESDNLTKQTPSLLGLFHKTMTPSTPQNQPRNGKLITKLLNYCFEMALRVSRLESDLKNKHKTKDFNWILYWKMIQGPSPLVRSLISRPLNMFPCELRVQKVLKTGVPIIFTAIFFGNKIMFKKNFLWTII